LKRETYLKDKLRNIYRFDDKSANSKTVQQLKQEAAAVDEDLSDDDEDDIEAEDDDDDGFKINADGDDDDDDFIDGLSADDVKAAEDEKAGKKSKQQDTKAAATKQKQSNSKKPAAAKKAKAAKNDDDNDDDDGVNDLEGLQASIKKAAAEEQEQVKDAEYSFDEFLDSLKDRPGFRPDDPEMQNLDDDDVFQFSDDEDDDDGEGDDGEESEDDGKGITAVDTIDDEKLMKNMSKKKRELMNQIDYETEQMQKSSVWDKLTEAKMLDEGSETYRLAVMNFDWTLISVRI